jgi:hypothetical protein
MLLAVFLRLAAHGKYGVTCGGREAQLITASAQLSTTQLFTASLPLDKMSDPSAMFAL